MSEVKKCPKCRGEMVKAGRMVAMSGGGMTFVKGDFIANLIIPFYCKKCGYIELYRKIEK